MTSYEQLCCNTRNIIRLCGEDGWGQSSAESRAALCLHRRLLAALHMLWCQGEASASQGLRTQERHHQTLWKGTRLLVVWLGFSKFLMLQKSRFVYTQRLLNCDTVFNVCCTEEKKIGKTSKWVSQLGTWALEVLEEAACCFISSLLPHRLNVKLGFKQRNPLLVSSLTVCCTLPCSATFELLSPRCHFQRQNSPWDGSSLQFRVMSTCKKAAYPLPSSGCRPWSRAPAWQLTLWLESWLAGAGGW